MNENSIREFVAQECFGPFIVVYCRWLHKIKREQNLEKLVFCARDGFLLKRVYDVLYPNNYTIYLRVSRKSLRLPYFYICDSPIDFIKILPPFQKYSVRDFIHSIYDVNAINIPKEIDMDYEVYLSKLLTDSTFAYVYDFMKEELAIESKRQYTLLKDYLIQEGVSGKCGLIDHSYKATSQYLLGQIFKGDPSLELFGLYFSYNSIAFERVGNKMDALLCGKISKSNRIVFERAILFELIIFEPIGSTIKYKRLDDGKIIPIHNEYYEYSNRAILDDIQKKIINYVYDINETKSDVDLRLALKKILALLKYPNREIAEYLGRLENDDIKAKRVCIAPSPFLSISNNLNYAQLIKQSIWRQGVIAQLPMGTIMNLLFNTMLKLGTIFRK